MKKFYYLSSFIFVVFIAFGCTRQVNLQTFRPAEITIPGHIKTVVIIDRTAPKNEKMNILEGVLTGEGLFEDKNATQEAMTSFQQTLLTSPRFQVVRGTERLIGNSLVGSFPEPISWVEISKLSAKYKADAVIAIELFDSDFIITDGKKNVKKTEEVNGQKREVEVVQYFAEGVGSVKTGFRIYDSKKSTITHQQIFTQSNTWKASGSSLKDAYAALVNKTQATLQVSRMAGSSYANRIAPMPMTISRTFYTKPKGNIYMTQGVRQAEVNKWDEPIKSWQNGITFTNTKTAGKLTYNIAIGYEVLGDFQQAKEWANKAYVNYGNKKARDYSNTLNYRIRNEDLVKEQLQ